MLDTISSYLLNKDISLWYLSIGEDYESYNNPAFDINIIFELIDDSFILSVFKGDKAIVTEFSFSCYSKKSDAEILDYILKNVWRLINEKEV